MEFGIDRVTDYILFDEKMGGTSTWCSDALMTRTFRGESGNHSAVHTDLITDLREASRLEIDGELGIEPGEFRLLLSRVAGAFVGLRFGGSTGGC
jgi:aminopeptidase